MSTTFVPLDHEADEDHEGGELHPGVKPDDDENPLSGANEASIQLVQDPGTPRGSFPKAVTRDRNNSQAAQVETADLPPSRMCIKAALCASLNSILLGYDIGIISAVVVLLEQDMDLTSTQIEVFVSSLNFMAILGAVISGQVSDMLGRTRTLAAASLLFLVGNGVMAIASGMTLLMLGRCITGIGVGCGLSIDPLYISEISPPQHRGKMVTFSETSINIGILLGFIIGFALSGMAPHIGWRVMLALGGVIPCLMLYLALYVMPETPRWLISKGFNERAETVLEGLCNTDAEKDATMSDIQHNIEVDKAAASKGWSAICSPTPGVRMMLVVVCFVAAAQQLCGIEAFMYYSPKILEESGFESTGEQLGITMVMGIIKTGVIVAAAALLDGYGRRKLLLWSLFGLIVAQLMLAIGFVFEMAALNVCGLFLFVIAFSFGIGPICWLFASEILPLEIRARGMMLACSINRLFSAIIALGFLSIVEAIGTAGTFFMFAAITLACLWFVYIAVPETKGMTLEEMESYFNELAANSWLFGGKSQRHELEHEVKQDAIPRSTAKPINDDGGL